MSPSGYEPGRGLLLTFGLMVAVGILGWFILPKVTQGTMGPGLRAAHAALRVRDTTKATASFETMVKAQPQSPEVYQSICEACANAGAWEMMADYARRGAQACKYAPNQARALLYMQLALALSETETTRPQTQAIEAAQHAQELSPRDPQILNTLGYILVDNDTRLKEAEDFLMQALQTIQEQPDSITKKVQMVATQDSYGWLLYKQGKYLAAIDTLTQALCDLPDGVQLSQEVKVMYYHLGAAYRKAGNVEKARRALQAALQYDAQYAPALTELEELPPPPLKSPAPAPTKNKSEPLMNADKRR